jgi:hypothetical protein
MKTIEEISKDLFNSIIDNEDLDDMRRCGIIAQQEGYKVTCIAIISNELERSPLIKTAPKLYAELIRVSALIGYLNKSTNIELDAVKHDIDLLLAEVRGE